MSAYPDLELDQPLPQNVGAERTLLGAILLDGKAYIEASAKLKAEDFSLAAHRTVYTRMGQIIARGHACDIVTLAEELAKRKEIESVGGVAWLASLTEGLPRRLAITEYVAIVRDKALLRRLISVSSNAINRAADQSEDSASVLSAAREAIEALAADTAEVGLQRAGEFLADEYPTADKQMENTAKQRGLITGIDEFDEMTCGLQPAELIVIAARPSMGKSDLADGLAGHAAIDLGKVVALFTPEMSKLSVLNRIICAKGRIDRQRFRKGALTSDDRRYFADVRAEVEMAPLYIDDTSNLTLSRVRSQAAWLQARVGLDLVVVDYLQMMSTADQPNKYSREQEVSGISRGLKALAKDLNIPVVAMAQLSRDNTKRTDKRPILSDLRESGAIEQDADMVAFLHREEYYDRANEDVRGKGEIIIAKQRNGPVGTVQAAYNAATGRWADISMLNDQPEFFAW